MSTTLDVILSPAVYAVGLYVDPKAAKHLLSSKQAQAHHMQAQLLLMMLQGRPRTESCLLGRGQGLQRCTGSPHGKGDKAPHPCPETLCTVWRALHRVPGNVRDQVAQREQPSMGQAMAARLLKILL